MVRTRGTDSARVLQVIETKALRGSGLKKDPVREVTQYWDFNGRLLAEADNDPDYLADYIMWESERLQQIIKESASSSEPQHN